MKFRFTAFFAFIFLFFSLTDALAQVDSVIGQFTNSTAASFAGGVSGNGRLAVFESTANLATENPRNADGNREIFLFDYAQRRIFQITDTKSLLTDASKTATFDNVKVDIVNVRPVISTDGRWIAFGSNATCAYPGTSTNPAIVSATNPGFFNPNSTTANPCIVGTTNNLTNDANAELWLYQIPAVAAADLSSGAELPLTDLSAGTFTQVTNTLPSRLPSAGSTNVLPVIANDNRDPSINDDGNFTAFVSNRDLAPCIAAASATCGNAAPNFNNDEIYTYVRSTNSVAQVTATSPGTATVPTVNNNPTISGTVTATGNMRVAFYSNAENPIIGMTGGSNPEKNDEIYFSDLDANGMPAGTRKQVTQTAPPTAGSVINILNYGRRMSRDGRYIAFDSYAELENAGAVQNSFALYVYDTLAASNAFRRVGPRSDADSGASGGDIQHYPNFTDNDANGMPSTLVFQTRLNIKADGSIAATASDGLNPATERPAQIYSYPLNVPASTATFKRLTNLPAPSVVLASVQPLTSDSLSRMVFNMARTEIGTGNSPDLLSEGYYLYIPNVTAQSSATLNYFTGASRIPVSPSPVPTPSASPSPTPQTPAAVQGVSPGMLAIAEYSQSLTQPAVAQTAVGSLRRSFTLPIELSGVSVTVNGAAAGIKSVSREQVTFVVPPGLAPRTDPYPVVINNNGTVIKGSLVVVAARPDVFTFNPVPGPNGRARIFNATNRVLKREPFNVTTIKIKGGRRVPTVLRLYLTGVQGAAASNFNIRIGSTQITTIQTGAVLVEPGVYAVDFALPASLLGAGDQPVVVSISAAGVTYSARVDDTAPLVRIL